MPAMNVWPTDGADGSVATEARWRQRGRLWAPSGVVGGLFPTLAFPNLTVTAGAAWVDGHFAELLGNQVLTVTANGLAVVRFDPAANTAELLYRDGVTTPAQDPNGVWELPIAQITGSVLKDVRPISNPAKEQATDHIRLDLVTDVGGNLHILNTTWQGSLGTAANAFVLSVMASGFWLRHYMELSSDRVIVGVEYNNAGTWQPFISGAVIVSIVTFNSAVA